MIKNLLTYVKNYVSYNKQKINPNINVWFGELDNDIFKVTKNADFLDDETLMLNNFPSNNHIKFAISLVALYYAQLKNIIYDHPIVYRLQNILCNQQPFIIINNNATHTESPLVITWECCLDISPKTVYIIVRGTSTYEEKDDDLDYSLIDVIWNINNQTYKFKFQKGFYTLFTKYIIDPTIPNIQEKIPKNIINAEKIYIIGHSLGAALTYLLSLYLSIVFPTKIIKICCIAPPRSGDIDFVNLFSKITSIPDIDIISVINLADPVPFALITLPATQKTDNTYADIQSFMQPSPLYVYYDPSLALTEGIINTHTLVSYFSNCDNLVKLI